MATPEQLKEARKLAVESPDIGKHGPRKTTLLKRKAEEIYVRKVAEKIGKITDIQLQEAEKPRNVTERIHVTRIIMGEVGEKKEGDKHLHLHNEISELTEAQRQLIEEYEAKLKELKTK